MLLVVGCNASHPVLPMDQAELSSAQNVAGVVSTGPKSPTSRLIHILDSHYVAKEQFAIDLGIGGEELKQAYEDFLDGIEAVQQDQHGLLEHLITQHGLTSIYLEGMSAGNAQKYDAALEQCREDRDCEPDLCNKLDQVKGMLLVLESKMLTNTPEHAEGQRLYDSLQGTLSEIRVRRLRVGAAGRLAVEHQTRLLPCEDEQTYRQANPLSDGTLTFDAELNEQREAGIVRNLQNGDAVTVVILGSAHDLSDNIPADCQYVRVAVKSLPE